MHVIPESVIFHSSSQTKSVNRLKHALQLTLTSSSENTLPLTVDWLQKYCDCKTEYQSIDIAKYVITDLKVVKLVKAQPKKSKPFGPGKYCKTLLISDVFIFF